MSKPQEPSFLPPKYWLSRLFIGMLRLVASCSYQSQRRLAKSVAAVIYRFAGRRRGIVEVNLRLCFPEWSQALRQQKSKEVFYHNVMGVFEAFTAYQQSTELFRQRLDILGAKVLEEAKAQGRGVLLIGAHYSHLDLGGALVSLQTPVVAIYRPHNNPLMDRCINQGRENFMQGVIARDNMRAMIRALKNNKVVWYPPDQDYGAKHACYAPFFGVNAATITATSRLAKFNQSPVVMLAYRRDDETGRYTLEFTPGPEGFPCGDEVQDATLINQALEDNIRKAPTQYMWTHRRFKTQPEGKAELYR